jgi:hypothetical protein
MSRMSMGNVRRSPDCRGGSICSHNPGGSVVTFCEGKGIYRLWHRFYKVRGGFAYPAEGEI